MWGAFEQELGERGVHSRVSQTRRGMKWRVSADCVRCLALVGALSSLPRRQKRATSWSLARQITYGKGVERDRLSAQLKRCCGRAG